MRSLTPIECRVLGSLVEKESTTPEYYPLSLNALVNACNQKSSRDPVMELGEADVRSALFELEALGLVRVLAEGRVSKFEHRAYDVFGLRRPEIALLGLLLLRGPQTAAELRARAERLYTFDDTEAVTATLDRLAQREPPLVLQLARQPGARESRWMHLLGDREDAAAASHQGSTDAALAPQAASELAGRVTELEQLVRQLSERVASLEADRQREEQGLIRTSE